MGSYRARRYLTNVDGESFIFELVAWLLLLLVAKVLTPPRRGWVRSCLGALVASAQASNLRPISARSPLDLRSISARSPLDLPITSRSSASAQSEEAAEQAAIDALVGGGAGAGGALSGRSLRKLGGAEVNHTMAYLVNIPWRT